MRQVVEQAGDEGVVVGHPVVRRDGAHQITVRDARGRELLLLTNGRELQQWASCQLTVLRRRPL